MCGCVRGCGCRRRRNSVRTCPHRPFVGTGRRDRRAATELVTQAPLSLSLTLRARCRLPSRSDRSTRPSRRSSRKSGQEVLGHGAPARQRQLVPPRYSTPARSAVGHAGWAPEGRSSSAEATAAMPLSARFQPRRREVVALRDSLVTHDPGHEWRDFPGW